VTFLVLYFLVSFSSLLCKLISALLALMAYIRNTAQHPAWHCGQDPKPPS